MRNATKLTPKQARFTDEYLVDLNATQAAIRAGYAVSRAHVTGSELVSNSRVSCAIAARRAELSEMTQLTQEWVLNGLKDITEKCKADRKPVVRLNRAERRMEQVIDCVPCPHCGGLVEHGVFEFDSQGANRAYELIGKHLGMFATRAMDMVAVTEVVTAFATATEEALKAEGLDVAVISRVTRHIGDLIRRQVVGSDST